MPLAADKQDFTVKQSISDKWIDVRGHHYGRTMSPAGVSELQRVEYDISSHKKLQGYDWMKG